MQWDGNGRARHVCAVDGAARLRRRARLPASSAPSASAESDIDKALFNSSFKPSTGAKTGGTLVMGEWQPPDNLNPFYTTAFTTVEAISPALRSPLGITQDGKYFPDLAASIPTIENGGVVDHRQHLHRRDHPARRASSGRTARP